MLLSRSFRHFVCSFWNGEVSSLLWTGNGIHMRFVCGKDWLCSSWILYSYLFLHLYYRSMCILLCMWVQRLISKLYELWQMLSDVWFERILKRIFLKKLWATAYIAVISFPFSKKYYCACGFQSVLWSVLFSSCA